MDAHIDASVNKRSAGINFAKQAGPVQKIK